MAERKPVVTGGGPGSTVNIYGKAIPRGVAKPKAAPAVVEPLPEGTDNRVETIGWQLRFTTGRSDKQYRIVQAGSLVIFSWGRAGAVGQASVQRCASAEAASRLAGTKTEEKLRSGYQMETAPSYVLLDPLVWIRATRTGQLTKERFAAAWAGQLEPLSHTSSYWGASRLAENIEVELTEAYQVVQELFPHTP